MTSVLEALSKDQLVLAMLAVMGGEREEVNERDLFLACWHAFPNAMRWTDSALPNPDTFTASLRRLDADGAIQRLGKQERSKRRKSTRRRTVLDAGRSGVVKARIAQGGLELAGVTPEAVKEVAKLAPPSASYARLRPAMLIALCAGFRTGRQTDEGALVELAFHRFPAVFAYRERPEFPDTGRIREAIKEAQRDGLIDRHHELTEAGRAEVDRHGEFADVRADASESYKTGALRAAARIEESLGYQAFRANGTLVATKGDELFRLLRVPPTTDPRPLVSALEARAQELRRVDRGELVDYLIAVARRHNPDVLPLLSEELLPAGVVGTPDPNEEG